MLLMAVEVGDLSEEEVRSRKGVEEGPSSLEGVVEGTVAFRSC